MKDALPERLQHIRHELGALGAEALLVSRPANVRYLSGFSSPEDGQVLITPTSAFLITDGRYTTQTRDESWLEVVIAPGRGLEPILKDLVGDMRLAFESDVLSYEIVMALNEGLQARNRAPALPSSGIVRNLRLVKHPEEIAVLREAARITDVAFEHILTFIRPGVREIEVALELDRCMRLHGAECPSFAIIVASGVRSALPHGVASNKVIDQGDLVTLDFGARVSGYHADMTRTIAVGEVHAELRAMYDVVLEAQEAAVAHISAQLDGKEADALARTVIEGHGYGSYFVHGLGHGVGLEIHEMPHLSHRRMDVLKPNMAVTIEPGVYVPDKGGVRIEDLVVLTEEGCEQLSHSPKTFIQL